MTSWPKSLILASVILALSAPADAQEVAPLNLAGRGAAPDHAGLARVEPAWPNSVFACGTPSTQLLAGAYFSGQPGPIGPIFNYLPVSARFGSMLTGPEDYWWGKGNFECLCDTTGAIIISDYGTWLAGQTYYLRYHCLDAGACLVPYLQLGLGWLLTDAYRDRTQEAIGQMLEFQLHYAVGVKYFVTPNLSFDIEAGIQHISNADLATRNHGVNAYGGQIGFTYYFPASRP